MAIQYVKSADIGKDRYEWLESHPEIEFAKMVRDVIDRKMKFYAEKEEAK